jgi:hypothetical protein
MKSSSKTSDARGELSFTAWKPGESGLAYFRRGQQRGELKFNVDDTRRVTLEVPAEK